MELLVAVDHNQPGTMASETVDPIDWSHPSPSWAVPSELHVLYGVNAAYKSQDFVHQPGLESASTGMPDQRTTGAATQGIPIILSFDSVTYLFYLFFLNSYFNFFSSVCLFRQVTNQLEYLLFLKKIEKRVLNEK